mmetsp:Transcript_5684/g.8033  ORF Transcript_5684/g.8033 Transcript_5684/m.8033 type:complete len:227 (-) Transcript_5684:147-827(-)
MWNAGVVTSHTPTHCFAVPAFNLIHTKSGAQMGCHDTVPSTEERQGFFLRKTQVVALGSDSSSGFCTGGVSSTHRQHALRAAARHRSRSCLRLRQTILFPQDLSGLIASHCIDSAGSILLIDPVASVGLIQSLRAEGRQDHLRAHRGSAGDQVCQGSSIGGIQGRITLVQQVERSGLESLNREDETQCDDGLLASRQLAHDEEGLLLAGEGDLDLDSGQWTIGCIL